MIINNAILQNQTVVSSGSFVYNVDDSRETILFWNIMGPVTGTDASIQFMMQEIDPFDRVSVVGQTVNSTMISNTGTGNIILPLGISPFILITWIVTGTLPSFSNTNLAAISRDVSSIINVSQSVDAPPITIVSGTSSINTTSSVAASTTNITLLASNINRLGATIYNDSASLLYVKLGQNATTTDFTIKLFPQCYYEIPFGWTGEVDGFWLNINGNARISELTP